MNYNELLNKISSKMQSASVRASTARTPDRPKPALDEDTTSIMLNKIGLEIQRQGGF